MTGGTFMWNDTGDDTVGGLSTGYFLLLSAMLAEVTTNSSYLQAAEEAAAFIQTHLSNPGGFVQEQMQIHDQDACFVWPSSVPTNSGLMIEGLSILYSITRNTTVLDSLNQLLEFVIPNRFWQGTNGVVAEPGQSSDSNGTSGDMNLLQGLGAAYMRNVTTAAMRQYIGAYIGVQFNAILDLATTGDSNIYGGSWTGPPSSKFLGGNQTTALSVLIAAIDIDVGVAESNTSSASSSPSPSTPLTNPNASGTGSSKSSHHSLGAILGGVFGGLVAFGVVGASLFCFYARRRRAQDQAEQENLEPFTSLSSPTMSEVRAGGPEQKRGNSRRELGGLSNEPAPILGSSTGISSGAHSAGQELDSANSELPPGYTA